MLSQLLYCVNCTPSRYRARQTDHGPDSRSRLRDGRWRNARGLPLFYYSIMNDVSNQISNRAVDDGGKSRISLPVSSTGISSRTRSGSRRTQASPVSVSPTTVASPNSSNTPSGSWPAKTRLTSSDSLVGSSRRVRLCRNDGYGRYPVFRIGIALWDMAGTLLGAPVSQLFGGTFRDEVRGPRRYTG